MLSMFSAKGKELRVIDNHRFRKDKLINIGQRWRCTKKHCNTSFVTDLAGQNIIRGVEGQHNHQPVANLERDYIANSVKRKAVDDMSGRPAKMVRKEILFAPPEIRQNLQKNDVLLCRRRIVASRRAEYPSIPEDVDQTLDRIDWMIQNDKISTADNECMVLINDPLTIAKKRKKKKKLMHKKVAEELAHPKTCATTATTETKMAAKTALMVIANGSEDMEAVITIDILRRAGVEVTVAGVAGPDIVTCSNKVQIKPDESLCSAKNKNYDAIVLPGGLGGTKAFIESFELGEMLRSQDKAGKLIAAICAAPTALQAHRIALGKNITSYPAMMEQLKTEYAYQCDNVVVDKNIVTSRGPGTAILFGLKLAELLVGEKAMQCVAEKALLPMDCPADDSK